MFKLDLVVVEHHGSTYIPGSLPGRTISQPMRHNPAGAGESQETPRRPAVGAAQIAAELEVSQQFHLTPGLRKR